VVSPETAGIEAAGAEVPGVDAGGAADPVDVVAAVPAAGTGADEVALTLLEVNKAFCRLWAIRACLDLLSAMATPSCSARSKKLI